MKKLLIISIVLLFTIALIAEHGTGEGTTIDSTVTVGGANFPDDTDNAPDDVLAIEGGIWYVPADQTGGIAGATFPINTSLTNYGNKSVIETFNVSAFESGDSGADAGGAWNVTLSNVSDAVADIATIDITAAGDKTIALMVEVASDAQDSSWREWSLRAIPDSGSSTAHYYDGDNTFTYGGVIGENVAGRIDSGLGIATTNGALRLTVSGPVIAVTKTIDSTTITDGNAPGNDAYPGATITYKIAIANTGSGDATSVYVADTIPANTTVVSGALAVDVSADESGRTYGTANGVTDADDADAGATDGTDVLFAPGGSNATAGAGAGNGIIEAPGGNDEATCWYRVTID